MNTPSAPKATRLPTGPLLVVALVVVSTLFAVPPVWDAVSAEEVGYIEMTRPLAYLLGAPLFGVWDSLSLLTLSQHYALLVTLIVLYVAIRVRAPRANGGLARRIVTESGRAVLAFVLLLGFYVAGLLLPRPMVGVEVTDRDRFTIDFHSHTKYSHDGWALFTAARNRAWHEAGGFDVAYVTDHYTWAGFDDAEPNNPERLGERTTLLIGAEIRIHRRPTNILGARERYLFALDSDSLYMEPDSLRAAYARGGRRPTLLYTMPGHLQYVVPFTEDEASGVIGIELNDGSPRGLEQVKSERSQILALADSADLAVIAAANLHGWGRTVAAWSVMELPGWQDLTPSEIGDEIEAKLHAERRGSVEVVERRMPYHGGSRIGLALTLPWLTWEHFRMLGFAERLAWLVWVGLIVGWTRWKGESRVGRGPPEPAG